MCATKKNLHGVIDRVITGHNVPAISLAVLHDDKIYQSASGILNADTGVEATPDSIFQVGSITKVMTTCLLMQLVDECRVDLDRPVKQYLQDFMIADSKATELITVRQLINHTSGMMGDFFPNDRGHVGNLIARYVDRCNLLPLVHSPGTHYSYSNSAFVIAGRLIEVVRGISWYQAMKKYIFMPLGMKHALADPQEMIRHRAAIGHDWDGMNWVVSNEAWLPLGMAPCGTSPAMSAMDLILFAQMHLEGGTTQANKVCLSNKSVRAMQNKEIRLPKTCLGITQYSGLGWALKDYHANDRGVYGHTGATNGFYSSLQVCPSKNAAFALLINGNAPSTMDRIQNDLMREVFGLQSSDGPAINRSAGLSLRHRSLVGRYESMDKIIMITEQDGQLVANIEYKIDSLPPENLKLYQVTDNGYACESLDGTRRSNWAFVMGSDPDLSPIHLFDGSRLNPRC